MQIPRQVLVRIRLLLKRKGINVGRIYFLSHAVHFEEVMLKWLKKKMSVLLSKFTVLCIFSYFIVSFFKLKSTLFYNTFVLYSVLLYICLLLVLKIHNFPYKHTHTHTHIYIYIYYIYIYIYIYIIYKTSSQCPRTVGVDYSLHRIYEGNHINLWECSMNGYC